jgi:phosphoribosylglycinamide formyltransferase-1
VTRLAILLSGRGSNFEAIARNVAAGLLDAEIAVVVSNVSGAKGIETARALGLETLVLPSKGLDRDQYDRELAAELVARRVDWVCLAGFMRLLGPDFIRAFPNRILNIHPSLLPSFPGLHAQRQALDHGVKVTGCTVHLVDAGLDSGPIVRQAAVEVLDGDNEETLSLRILEQEHKIYTEAIRLAVSGRLRIDGRRTYEATDVAGVDGRQP